MAKHTAEVHIPASEVERINRLLAITSLEDMSDDELLAQGANTHDNKNVYHVKFDDGSSLTFDLCSGTENYYDDVVWLSADGSQSIVLECEFELDDIEVEIESETYIVSIIKE